MVIVAAITLALAPWRGPSLPTATANAVKYKLTVHGPPRQRVELHADGLPGGWVASFCTPAFCSPFRYAITLNGRGIGVIEFQGIRTADSAPKHVAVTISASGAAPITVRL